VPRPRFLAPIGAIATALALGPALGAATLAADPTVVVQAGDTLSGISRRQNVSIADLVALNGLSDPNRIYAGQLLRTGSDASPPPAVPAVPPAPVAAPAANPATHSVQRGETLTSIARRYGVSVAAIVAANALADPNRIYGGQQLAIPGAAAQPPAAAPSVPPAAPPPAAAPAPAPPSMPPSMAALVAARDAVRQVIAEEATAFGVPVPLALAVAWQESGWRQEVISRAGAVGVMQLLPTTATWVGEVMLGTPVNIADTRENVRAGVRLLAHYLARYGGDQALALAAYYQGQRAADTYGIFPTTRPYIASIVLLQQLFGG